MGEPEFSHISHSIGRLTCKAFMQTKRWPLLVCHGGKTGGGCSCLSTNVLAYWHFPILCHSTKSSLNTFPVRWNIGTYFMQVIPTASDSQKVRNGMMVMDVTLVL